MIDSNSLSKIASIRILPSASRIATEYINLESSGVSFSFARHIINAIKDASFERISYANDQNMLIQINSRSITQGQVGPS